MTKMSKLWDAIESENDEILSQSSQILIYSNYEKLLR